jgi:RimK family alpha-L-glutamate ligase
VKLLIITAEPENFVPVELKKQAEAQGNTAEIVNIDKTFMVEGYTDKGEKSTKVFVVDKEMKSTEVSGNVCIPRLNEYCLEYKIGLLHRLADCGVQMLNSPDAMMLCNDKLRSQVVLNSANIKTPYSLMMTDGEFLDATLEQAEKDGKLKFPMIIKTLRGTHGIGVMKVDSKSSLTSVAQTLLKEDMHFMLQEFIEHKQSARIIMIGDQLLAANMRGQPEGKDEFRTNSHLGSETTKYEPSEEELALGARIVELFGARFCAIDYIILEKDGKKEFIVLEVNGSPGLEAMQKNWPDKNLPATVTEFAAKLTSEACLPATAELRPETNIQNVTPVTAELPVAPADPEVVEPQPDVPTDIPADPLTDVEEIVLHRINNNLPFAAKVDTGATLSSLHASAVSMDDNWVKFTHGDVSYKVPLSRTILIKNAHTSDTDREKYTTRRPIIKLDVTVRGQRYNGIEFTLNDRTNMKYDVLIGRNLLGEIGLPIIVTAKKPPQGSGPAVEEE